MGENALQVLSTTVDNMNKVCAQMNVLILVHLVLQVLWPFLLEFLIQEKFSSAITALCKCIGHIASKMREDQDESFYVDFDASANVPKPPALFARLMVTSD
jgi:hypothetical protein